MSKPIIQVHGLSKQYSVGARQESYSTLRESLAGAMQSPFKRFHRKGSASQDNTIWALRDISFDVQPGEVVGIIGRNGAGKSTLLKVLSRITEPTTGSIKLFGRVASLLEVGTGFHPELTGRENIFLNGAILGMSRHEIKRQFDSVVEFAEVEKFIDTPVKRYSSGMYLRLAFAVAAYLEPEILVVDEVLAVGDAQFQKKCLGKMSEVARAGRTVLFVSHNMAAIQQLCSRGICLQYGSITHDGNVQTVIDDYLENVKLVSSLTPIAERKDRQGSGRVRIVGFYVNNKNGVAQQVLRAGEDYTFVMQYECIEGDPNVNNAVGSIGITDNKNDIVLLVRSNFTNQNFSLHKKRGTIECEIKDFNLAAGFYDVILFLADGEVEILDLIEHAQEVLVEAGDYFGTGNSGLPSHCKVLTRADWRAE